MRDEKSSTNNEIVNTMGQLWARQFLPLRLRRWALPTPPPKSSDHFVAVRPRTTAGRLQLIYRHSKTTKRPWMLQRQTSRCHGTKRWSETECTAHAVWVQRATLARRMVPPAEGQKEWTSAALLPTKYHFPRPPMRPSASPQQPHNHPKSRFTRWRSMSQQQPPEHLVTRSDQVGSFYVSKWRNPPKCPERYVQRENFLTLPNHYAFCLPLPNEQAANLLRTWTLANFSLV